MQQGAGILATPASRGAGSDPLRVLLACCGLDHARRGYESFARECFEALRAEPGVRIELAKASGPPSEGEHLGRALRRDRAIARTLGRLLQVRPFRLEALSFALGLQPVIDRWRPQVVYVSEWDTARGLTALRAVRGQPFRVLLCNGGFAAEGFEHLDHTQELTPAALDYVVRRGADPARHTVLPLGFALSPKPPTPVPEERRALRERLGLPARARIVLSVAALNRTHKRLDYLIDEIASLATPRPFLVMLGEPDEETTELGARAERQLGPEGYTMRTVAADAVGPFHLAADVFVLSSLAEMQGRAVVEAAAQGLPCIVHDSPVMRYALGDHGRYGDLSSPGTLRALLEEEAHESPEERQARGQALHAHVYERFSWDRLRPRYVELFRAVASANSTVSSSTGEKLPR